MIRWEERVIKGKALWLADVSTPPSADYVDEKSVERSFPLLEVSSSLEKIPHMTFNHMSIFAHSLWVIVSINCWFYQGMGFTYVRLLRGLVVSGQACSARVIAGWSDLWNRLWLWRPWFLTVIRWDAISGIVWLLPCSLPSSLLRRLCQMCVFQLSWSRLVNPCSHLSYFCYLSASFKVIISIDHWS